MLQSTPVNSYPDNSDLRLIRMYLRSPFREDQSNIIRLNRIPHYSYYFIRSPVIRIRRILLYTVGVNLRHYLSFGKCFIRLFIVFLYKKLTFFRVEKIPFLNEQLHTEEIQSKSEKREYF